MHVVMKKNEVIDMKYEGIIKKLDEIYEDREPKSISDVERKIMVLRGTTKLKRKDREIAKFYFKEFQKFREFEY